MATNNANDFSNPIAISQGGTNASSMGTTDGVVYYDGSALVTTDAGISMQLLTSNGAGNAPTWQAGGGGAPSGVGWDLIQTQDFSGLTNTLDFTTGITNAYNTYVAVYSYGAATQMNIRYSTNGGVSYATSGYTSTAQRTDLFAGGAGSNDADTSRGIINSGNNSSAHSFGSIVYLFNVTSGLETTMVAMGANNRRFNICAASFGNSAAIDALRFIGIGISQNAVSTVSLYGVNES